MDRPRLLIACVLAVAFVALFGFAAADDRGSVGESVLEEAQNPNNSAMMAKLEAEAANLKKVLARQQAEKQAIAQSQQPSEHHSNQPGDKTSPAQVDSTPAVARDSKSTKPLKQYPQDTLSVRPADTPAADTHSGGATVVDSGSPSVEDTVPVSPVPAQVDSTPAVTGDSKSTEPLKQQPKDDIVPESPVESPEEQTIPADTSAPVEQTIPGDTSAKSIEPQTLPAKNDQSTKNDDDEIETIWKFYDEHQMIFNVVWISLGALAAAIVVGLLHHGCTTGSNVKNRRVYH